MYGILKSMAYETQVCDRSDTEADSPDPSPTDPWLFTDPVAREIYRRREQLEVLEEDICTYVMVAGHWALEELEFKCEIRRLLREELIAPGSSFGYLSPHPTTYYARGEGKLKIAGQGYPIEMGDEVIFEPWLARLANPGLGGPGRVGRVRQVATALCLCCDAFPRVCIHCDKTRAILRQILNYRNHGI